MQLRLPFWCTQSCRCYLYWIRQLLQWNHQFVTWVSCMGRLHPATTGLVRSDPRILKLECETGNRNEMERRSPCWESVNYGTTVMPARLRVNDFGNHAGWLTDCLDVTWYTHSLLAITTIHTNGTSVLWTNFLQKIVIELTCSVKQDKSHTNLVGFAGVLSKVFDVRLPSSHFQSLLFVLVIWKVHPWFVASRLIPWTVRQVRFSNRWTCSSDHRLLEGSGNCGAPCSCFIEVWWTT